jgi:hypothetical protein
VIVRVKEDEVRTGDIGVAWGSNIVKHNASITGKRMEVRGDVIWVDGQPWHRFGTITGFWAEVARAGYMRGPPELYQLRDQLRGPSRKVADWPKQCPKCGRAESAVLLFSSWDCRHGCFK